MSDTTTSITEGEQIRIDIANADETVYAPAETEIQSDGSQASVSGSIATDTYLTIDTVPGAGVAEDLFLGSGFSLIENYNDTSPIIATSAPDGTSDPTTSELVYQGDAGDQTFYAGTGTEYAAFTGYGNTFATPSTGGGTYEITAGLANAAMSLTVLASAPTEQIGNNIVVASGDASIAAGLGYNHIFLGTGTAVIANEGHDVIIGGTGADTIDGVGSATVFAGASATTYDGQGGSALVIGGTVAGSGALDVYGGTGSVTVYGGTGDVAAYGGTAGNNVLVSGSGNASLVGGGSNDLLVASGAGSTTLVAGSGNETLFGGGATGTTNYFLGDGSDTVVGGTGTEYIQFGSGSSTVFGSTGNDTYGVLSSVTTGSATVIGFNTATDFLNLQGFGSVTASSFLADDTSVVNGSTFINTDGTGATGGAQIELYGVTDLSAANLVIPTSSIT